MAKESREGTDRARSTRRYYVVIFQEGDHRDDASGILSRELVHNLQDQLAQKIGTRKAETEIDVWLHSPGGDADAAYKLFLELRHRSRKLRAVILDYAKSAATLLALGMDEIFMSPAAELGPLDAQIPHPDREKENVIVSALDVANQLDFLGKFAVRLAIAGGAEILRSTELPRSEVLASVLSFAAGFVEPIAAKLDSNLIHRAGNQLAIAQKYAERMLPGKAEVIHRLVANYPAHSFVISREEAGEMGLPVRNAEDYDRLSSVVQMEEEWYWQQARGQSIIRVLEDADLDEAKSEKDDESAKKGGNQGRRQAKDRTTAKAADADT